VLRGGRIQLLLQLCRALRGLMFFLPPALAVDPTRYVFPLASTTLRIAESAPDPPSDRCHCSVPSPRSYERRAPTPGLANSALKSGCHSTNAALRR
jgi:hypothetical protein